MAPKRFTVGDRLLAMSSQGTAFYEAKIIDDDMEFEGRKGYMIHYQGWNKRHDEFIGEDELDERTKEFSEEGLARAKEELAATASKSKSKKRKSTKEGTQDGKSRDGSLEGDDETTVHSEEPSKQKRAGKRKHEVEVREVKPKNKLDLPQKLKVVLSEDYDLVNRQMKLYKCPAKKNIDTITQEYLTDQALDANNNAEVLLKYIEKQISARQVVQSSKGIQEYFNTLLPRQLLYKFEKPQFHDAVENHKKSTEPPSNNKKKRASSANQSTAASLASSQPFTPATYYGLPHLLRLLTRFEDMLKQSTFNDRIRNNLLTVVGDFVAYLDKNHEKYFNGAEDYVVGSPEYQREAFV